MDGNAYVKKQVVQLPMIRPRWAYCIKIFLTEIDCESFNRLLFPVVLLFEWVGTDRRFVSEVNQVVFFMVNVDLGGASGLVDCLVVDGGDFG